MSLKGPFATLLQLASSGGAALIGYSPSGTVQQAIDGIVTFSNGKFWSIETPAQVALTTVPATVDYIQTASYAYSLSVANRGGGGIYKRVSSQPAHAGKIQSLDGAWWELQAPINVAQFGAIGDGTTDNTTAFNNAIAYANLRSPNNPLTGALQGTRIGIPEGRFRIVSALNPITQSAVTVQGVGVSSTLLLEANGDAFTWSPQTLGIPYDVVEGGLTDCKVEYVSAPGASARVAKFDTAVNVYMRNLQVKNIGGLCQLGDATNSVNGCVIDNVTGYVANITGPVIRAVKGSLLTVTDTCNLYVNGVAAPAVDRVSVMTVVAGRTMFRLGENSWDTYILGGVYNRFDFGLDIVTATTMSVIDGWLKPSLVLDYCSTNAVRLNAVSNSNILTLKAHGLWAASWSGAAINIIGTGNVAFIDIDAIIPSAGTQGVAISGANSAYIDVKVTSYGANRTDVNAASVYVLGGTHINVHDCKPGVSAAYGFAWQPAYGIYFGPDLDYFNVTNNDAAGTTAAYFFDTNATGSANRHVTNNLNANYAGLIGSGVFTQPATGVTWTNTTPYDVEAVFAGAFTNITKNGQLMALTGNMTLTFSPGDTFIAVYGGSPNIFFYIKP